MSFSSDWTFEGSTTGVRQCAKSIASKGGLLVRFDNLDGSQTCVFVLPKAELDSIVRNLDRSSLDAVVGVEPIDEESYALAIDVDSEEGTLRLESNEYHNSSAWEVGCLLIRLLAEALNGEPADDASDELLEMLSSVPKIAKPPLLN